MYRGRILLLETHEVAVSRWFETYSFQICNIKNTGPYLLAICYQRKGKCRRLTPLLCLFHSLLRLLSQYISSTAEHVSLALE